jgi:hypothetical protein
MRLFTHYWYGKRLSVSHRESNIASKAANQHFGFRYSHREACNCLDGTTEDVLYYVLDLPKGQINE